MTHGVFEELIFQDGVLVTENHRNLEARPQFCRLINMQRK